MDWIEDTYFEDLGRRLSLESLDRLGKIGLREDSS